MSERGWGRKESRRETEGDGKEGRERERET